jgi:DNA repair protein RecN (Recombination protein N)
VFDVPGNPEISGILEREGIEYDGRTVVVWRELTASGRNICRICGVMVPVSLLKEIGGKLMDIHGQHEHQFLMDPQMHLQFL